MTNPVSSILLATCILASCCQEKFESKIISEETNDKGVTLVTSEVYPGDGDTIKVWIGLPSGEWDGRLVGTGGSGYSGGNRLNAEYYAAMGMVGVASNCGHDVKNWSFLYDEGSLNEVQLRDFGHYALHVMTVYAKQYVNEKYGRKPSYCYFIGSSTGGRHALQVAQKYPKDYNAVFSGCPAWHNDLYVPARAWAQVVMKDEGHLMPLSKFDYARKALIAFEDPKDGLDDGIVNNPFDCSFDIDSLAGTTDPATGEKFTSEDARVIKRIWDGCPYGDGKLWYYFTPTTDFHLVASSNQDGTGKLESTTLGLLRYATEFNPEFCLDSLSVDRYIEDVIKCGETLEGGMSASADLRPFRKAGGKLLIMHGPETILHKKDGFGCRPFYPYPIATEYLGGDIDMPESFGPTESLKESYLKENASVSWR